MQTSTARLTLIICAYLTLTSILLIYTLFFNPSLILHLVLLLGLLIPEVVLFGVSFCQTTRQRWWIGGLIGSILGSGLLLVLVRPLRALLPLTGISDQKVLSYTQYSGYPIYFDTVVTFVILFSPLVVLPLVKLLHKKLYVFS